MSVLFTPNGWDDYSHWLQTDQDIFAKVNTLINDARRSPFRGLGKPEPLRRDRSGWWSLLIHGEHRLVYRVTGSGDDQHIEVAQYREHY